MTMKQKENLVGRMTFSECKFYLENDAAMGMEDLMMDHMEELDKARFMAFMETF